MLSWRRFALWMPHDTCPGECCVEKGFHKALLIQGDGSKAGGKRPDIHPVRMERIDLHLARRKNAALDRHLMPTAKVPCGFLALQAPPEIGMDALHAPADTKYWKAPQPCVVEHGSFALVATRFIPQLVAAREDQALNIPGVEIFPDRLSQVRHGKPSGMRQDRGEESTPIPGQGVSILMVARLAHHPHADAQAQRMLGGTLHRHHSCIKRFRIVNITPFEGNSMNGCTSLFGTKAETLDRLSQLRSDLNIPDSQVLTFSAWRMDPAEVLRNLRGRWPGAPRLAVRSSCSREDGMESSCAGAFTSILNVPLTEETAVRSAVDTVFASYPNAEDEHVLIQPMVADIAVSGVIMTRGLDDGSPYYVINYDDESGKTDTVTGGKGVSKTVCVYRGVKAADFDSPRVRLMVDLARSLEKIFGCDALDIEFGLDTKGVMHLFQVRRICAGGSWCRKADRQMKETLSQVAAQVTSHLAPTSDLHGATNILGVMPDWNPAEIIGVTPRPLAASLYRHAVTKRVWSLAREEMGYRTMPPQELMLLILGRPYIDVRASFNSFLPDGLEEDTGRRLVSGWLAYLESHPEFHDKVEFEVAFTAADFDLKKRLHERYPDLLSASASSLYLDSLTALTRRALDLSPAGTLAMSSKRIDILGGLHACRGLPSREGPPPQRLREMAFAYLEECRILGTLPFAILARHAFIAETLLRSAIRRGALDAERLLAFKGSVVTISRKLAADFEAVSTGRMDKTIFMARYGHLRPGTYDVLSPRYADRKGLFESGHTVFQATEQHLREDFTLTRREKQALELLLREAGLDVVSAEGLLGYAGQAIAGREYGKFVFTRNISDVLECLRLWGEASGLDRETLSFLTLEDVAEQRRDAQDAVSLREAAARNRAEFNLGRSLKLSYLIRSPRDIYIVPQHRSAPNFITTGRVEAPVTICDASTNGNASLGGHIVCIENADPGFDWIFTKGIAGLVTKYGGANSHMAIRCAEYGIPAAIGCGDMLFGSVATSAKCLLDAGAHMLKGF